MDCCCRERNQPGRLWRLFSQVHELATGHELQMEEALSYFADPKRLAAVVERSGVLDDPEKRVALQQLLSERSNGL